MKKEFLAVKGFFQSQIVVMPIHQMAAEELNKFTTGEVIYAMIRTIPENKRRSIDQLDLYWAACSTLADNTEDPDWNSQAKVDDQCRIKANWIEPDSVKWIETEFDGKKYRFKHFRTKSISFENCEHLDACGYFTDAFRIQAEFKGMDVDSWIEFVKSKMKGRNR